MVAQHGVLEAMRAMAHQLQSAAGEPSSDGGDRSGLRPGPDPAGRGPALPTSEQPETANYQPEGDQPQTANVTGRS